MIDTAEHQVPFSTCFTYCLAVICADMNGLSLKEKWWVDDLDRVLSDPEIDLPSLLQSILISTLSVYKTAASDTDKHDFKTLLHNVFRLITVLTYDPRTCELLARGDIQYTSRLIKEKKALRRGEEVSAEEDESRLLLLETLQKVVMYCIDDIVITVHFSSILRNLSCCSKSKNRGYYCQSIFTIL